MTNALLTCIMCNDIFRSRYDLSNHVRHKHQSFVKVEFKSGSVTEVKRGEDGMFKCECGKGFKFPSSFKRLVKGCDGEAIGSYEGEEEDVQMQKEGSDLSESTEYDDEGLTLIDYFGALYSHEKG